ncbi:unnamed protein product [marine sediment metagenome]|uniref:Uncharacterized protein n=1 Tax=marine sediment metagenome TaxID=412755 RepID=X1V3Q5_9ZZZZ
MENQGAGIVRSRVQEKGRQLSRRIEGARKKENRGSKDSQESGTGKKTAGVLQGMKIEVPGMGWRVCNNLYGSSVPAMGFSSGIWSGVVQEIRRKKPVNGEGDKIAESWDK